MSNLEGVVATTERLRLRVQTIEDAPFLLSLMTDPDWVRYVGDRGVRTVRDVERYVLEGAVAQQAEHGTSLYLVERREDLVPVGICGLVTREGLGASDLGYAFLPEHRGRGYARESARAVLEVARGLGKTRVLAVVTLDKLAGDPVDVYVNGRLIARGEVLVLSDNFCVRVTELIVGDSAVA